jgi:hypothetical protein
MRCMAGSNADTTRAKPLVPPSAGMLDVSLDRTCLARSIIDSLPEPAKGVHAKVTLKKGGARSRCVFHIGGGSSRPFNSKIYTI